MLNKCQIIAKNFNQESEKKRIFLPPDIGGRVLKFRGVVPKMPKGFEVPKKNFEMHFCSEFVCTYRNVQLLVKLVDADRSIGG